MRSRTFSPAKYKLSQVCSEFLFEFLNRVRPFDGPGSAVVVGDEIENRLLQGAGAEKMVWLKEFALQKTKPNLNLIQPGGVDSQPADLDAQLALQSESLFHNPPAPLFRPPRQPLSHTTDHA